MTSCNLGDRVLFGLVLFGLLALGAAWACHIATRRANTPRCPWCGGPTDCHGTACQSCRHSLRLQLLQRRAAMRKGPPK
jgi:tRNA(Ile2) C34 agmatinyltransferase TiaS